MVSDFYSDRVGSSGVGEHADDPNIVPVPPPEKRSLPSSRCVCLVFPVVGAIAVGGKLCHSTVVRVMKCSDCNVTLHRHLYADSTVTVAVIAG